MIKAYRTGHIVYKYVSRARCLASGLLNMSYVKAPGLWPGEHIQAEVLSLPLLVN